jgi:subfamily B ATP-binding cassette protein MsbA
MSGEEVEEITADEIFTIIREFSSEYWLLTGGFVLLTLTTTVIQIVVVSKFTARFQKALSDINTTQATWALFYMMGTMVIAFGLHYVYDMMENNLFPLFQAFAEKRLMRTIMEKNATGNDANSDPSLFREILIRTTHSAGNVYREILTAIIPSTLVVITMFVYLTWLNWKYGLIFIGAGGIIAGVSIGTQNRVMHCAKNHETLAKNAEWRAFDVIKNMPVISARNMVSVEVDDLGSRFDNVCQDKIKYRQLVDNVAYIIQLLSYIAVFAILWMAVWSFHGFLEKQPKGKKYIVQNKATSNTYAKEILTVIAVLMSTRSRLQSLSKSQINMTDSVGKFGFINNKVNELNSRVIEEGEIQDPVTNDIQFHELNITYEDPISGKRVPVLTDLNLSVNSNETIVIRGASGSGKSTLVNALLRFIEPDSGQVTIGGIPVEQFTLNSGLRRFTSFITAEQGILDRTIEENILYGATEDEIDLARVRATQLWSDFKDHLFPNKNMGDRAGPNGGCNLSTGQKTWVKIANLFVIGKDKKIVVLDEPTQGLDPKTKESILQLLERIRDSRVLTSLIITHDEECARVGDRVAQLVNGNIVDVS